MENNNIDLLSLITFALAFIVASIGILVWIYNIEILISNRNVPEMLNKPCAILFLMLAVIFFAVGAAGKEEEN